MPVTATSHRLCRPAVPAPAVAAEGEPFASTEEAWFWTMAALAARREGARGSGQGLKRPCEPDDVVRCLDQLYRMRRVDLQHARILRIWGERGAYPSPHDPREQSDFRFWREAIAALDGKLRARGIVV